MFTVIKLGGCNGSGKTSVARALLSSLPFSAGKARKPQKYVAKMQDGVEVHILGSYENTCGGMDTISDKEDRLALLKESCKPGRIIFYEGLITGKTYGAMGELSEKHVEKGKGRWIYAFMDTPFEVCVERVLSRRAAAGNGNPFDPERTMRPTFNSCVRLEEKLRKGVLPGDLGWKHPVLSLPHKKKPDKLAQLVLNTAMELHYDAR